MSISFAMMKARAVESATTFSGSVENWSVDVVSCERVPNRIKTSNAVDSYKEKTIYDLRKNKY